MLDKHIACLLVAQLSFCLFLHVLASARLVSVVPHEWSAGAWEEFSRRASAKFNVPTTTHRLALLMTVHMLNIFCCLPMPHLTHVMFGYWLGFWAGWTVCFTWEHILVGFFMYVVQDDSHCEFQRYVTSCRQHKRLSLQLSVVSASLLPLHTKSLIVKFSNVTRVEYMRENVFSTVLLSLQNVACGALLAQDTTAGTTAAVASVMALSVFLQVFCTAVVSGYTVCLLSKRRECAMLVAHDSDAHVVHSYSICPSENTQV